MSGNGQDRSLVRDIDSGLSAELEQMQLVTDIYRRRHSILTLIRMLNHLISAIQRHRGVSLAHLAGDGLFMEDVSAVQAQVNRRLWVMAHCCDCFDDLVADHVQANIRLSWNTVSHDWERDALLENFEYHSHLIEQLLQLSAELARQLAQPIAEICELPEAAIPQDSSPHSDWVLSLVSRGVPQLIENLARIRGIATHSAVIGRCDEEHHKKLRYWLQCAEQENQQLIAQIDNMDATMVRGWPSLRELKNYELKLAFFLNTVGRDIIHGDCKSSDARSLFDLGTQIIDVYVEGVDGGIAMLERGLESEFECWLKC